MWSWNAWLFHWSFIHIHDSSSDTRCDVHRILGLSIYSPVEGGDKMVLNNYRPISKLPILDKILESMINTQQREYLSNSNILINFQSFINFLLFIHSFFKLKLKEKNKIIAHFFNICFQNQNEKTDNDSFLWFWVLCPIGHNWAKRNSCIICVSFILF